LPLSAAPLRRARISVGAVFLIHAAVFGSWAPRIPAIKHHVGVGDGGLGVALAGLAVGLFVGTRVAGGIVDRFGSRRAIRVGALALCATLLGPALADDLATLTAALAVLGVVAGFLDVSMNAQAVAVERGYARPIMSGLHGLWSIGLLAGALGAAAAAAAGASPTLHFALVALGLASASLMLLGGLLSAGAEALPAEDGDAGLSGWRLLLAPVVLFLGLIAFSSFIGEGAAADWSAVYLRDNLDSSHAFATAAFAAFSFAMAASRFAADRLSARFGPAAVVRTGALVAAVGLAVGLALAEPVAAVIGFGLLGLGLAPVVPITFSAAGNTRLGPTGVILGRVVTIGYLGSIIGPVLIGAFASVVGLRTALLIPVALSALVALLAGHASSAVGGTRVSTPAWHGAEPAPESDGSPGL
jgi:MFS family permease